MVLALWIVQVLLALTVANAASRKLVRTEEKPSKSMAWREDISQETRCDWSAFWSCWVPWASCFRP